ncbi:DMT family transporter [Peptostreptococcaceae bacterium AGR-M142]
MQNLKNNSNESIFKKYIMVIACIFWAGAFIAGKFSVKEFPVFSLTFFRFFFAVILMIPILKIKNENFKIDKNDFFTFLKLGIIGMVGYHILFFMALKFTSSGNSSLIAATNPIITTILAYIFLKEKISIKNTISICISFFGVLIIITNGDINFITNMHFNKGDIIMVFAVFCWASYSIISKNILKKYSPLKVTFYAFLFCTLFLIPFVIYENPMSYIPNTSLKGWLAVLYMSIFASLIGYLIQQISIKNIGPSKTNLYINLVPMFSMIFAYFILGEPITKIKLIAGLFIVTGVYSNMKFKS